MDPSYDWNHNKSRVDLVLKALLLWVGVGNDFFKKKRKIQP